MSDKPLNPGEMTTRLRLRKVVTGRGAFGEVKPTEMVDVGKAWARMEPISNRKVRLAEQSQIIETCLFTLHPRQDIAIDWQVVTRDTVFTVRAVDRSQSDRLLITGEADARNDRAKP